MAEDVTSEAFLALLQQGERITQERLPAWLFTVARNRALDHWRHQATVEKYSAQAGYDRPGAPAPDALRPAWLEHKSLKPLHRVCLILHFVHGMTRAEIAQHLGLSEVKIKGHLQYGLRLLRKEMNLAGQSPSGQPAVE